MRPLMRLMILLYIRGRLRLESLGADPAGQVPDILERGRDIRAIDPSAFPAILPIRRAGEQGVESPRGGFTRHPDDPTDRGQDLTLLGSRASPVGLKMRSVDGGFSSHVHI